MPSKKSFSIIFLLAVVLVATTAGLAAAGGPGDYCADPGEPWSQKWVYCTYTRPQYMTEYVQRLDQVGAGIVDLQNMQYPGVPDVTQLVREEVWMWKISQSTM